MTSDTTTYALTRSRGIQTFLSTGYRTAEVNRAIFPFEQKDTDGWRIARYMFNRPA